MFDQDAPQWAKSYATGYSIAGFAGNISRAYHNYEFISEGQSMFAEINATEGPVDAGTIRMVEGAWEVFKLT